jgi:hypothetical protein
MASLVTLASGLEGLTPVMTDAQTICTVLYCTELSVILHGPALQLIDCRIQEALL